MLYKALHRNNAIKRPPGCHDFIGVKGRPGALTVIPGRFLNKYIGLVGSPGPCEKTKHTHTLPTHTYSSYANIISFWLMLIFGTGDPVLAGVTIADGSRDINTHDVGI